MDFDVCLGEMDCGIAERDDSSGSVGIELVKEWELGIACEPQRLAAGRFNGHAHEA